ncbi:MAG: helix-turn-helix domain-containing protein [Alkaliphilus sp.]
MYYNLEKFGTALKQIRKELSLSQTDLFELTGIAVATISRIELGQVLPKQDTLDILSAFLHQDLNKYLLECRVKSYECLENISNSIFNKIEVANYEDLQEDVGMLQKLLDTEMNDYYSTRCKQILSYVESMVSEIRHKNFDLTIAKLRDTIKLSIHDFELDNYKTQ